MKYHFNYRTWCPFTSFLFFLTQNVDPIVHEEKYTLRTSHTTCQQKQPLKRDNGSSCVTYLGEWTLFMASMLWTIWMYSHWWWHSSHPLRFLKIRLQTQDSFSQHRYHPSILLIHGPEEKHQLYKAENSGRVCFPPSVFVTSTVDTDLCEILAFLNPQSGLTLLGQSGQRMLSEASPGAKISP